MPYFESKKPVAVDMTFNGVADLFMRSVTLQSRGDRRHHRTADFWRWMTIGRAANDPAPVSPRR
jgi:hypothetical protein